MKLLALVVLLLLPGFALAAELAQPVPEPRKVILWSTVAADPKVKALNATEYDALRREYFNRVVKPEIATDDVQRVWADFESETRRASPPSGARDGLLTFLIFCLGFGGIGLGGWLGVKAIGIVYRAITTERMKRAKWFAAALIVLVTFFYSPYNLLQDRFGAASFGGYAWLWDISSIQHASVAWPMLLVEWVGLSIIGGLVWRAFRD